MYYWVLFNHTDFKEALIVSRKTHVFLLKFSARRWTGHSGTAYGICHGDECIRINKFQEKRTGYEFG